MDKESIANTVDLGVKKKYKELSNHILDGKPSFSLFDKTFVLNVKNDSEDVSNFINSGLYITDDINSLISNIKNKGYVVNAGPQP
jgi:hypothetical protein